MTTETVHVNPVKIPNSTLFILLIPVAVFFISLFILSSAMSERTQVTDLQAPK